MQQAQDRAAAIARKSQLTRPQSRLIELMQRLTFGRIVGLAIRDGMPDFSQRCRVVRTVKLGGDNAPRPEAAQPGVRMESLAHPQVTIYTLGATPEGRFRIESYQTYHARLAAMASGKANHEQDRTPVPQKSS